MHLKDVMRSPVTTALETDRLGELHRRMVELHVRHLPIVRAGKLVGILSQRDLLKFRAQIDLGDDWWRAPASAAMTTPVQTAGPDDSLSEAAGRMAAARIGALPVVHLGEVIGLVTTVDVLDAEVRAAMA